jgi:hypothetical protein
MVTRNESGGGLVADSRGGALTGLDPRCRSPAWRPTQRSGTRVPRPADDQPRISAAAGERDVTTLAGPAWPRRHRPGRCRLVARCPGGTVPRPGACRVLRKGTRGRAAGIAGRPGRCPPVRVAGPAGTGADTRSQPSSRPGPRSRQPRRRTRPSAGLPQLPRRRGQGQGQARQQEQDAGAVSGERPSRPGLPPAERLSLLLTQPCLQLRAVPQLRPPAADIGTGPQELAGVIRALHRRDKQDRRGCQHEYGGARPTGTPRPRR